MALERLREDDFREFMESIDAETVRWNGFTAEVVEQYRNRFAQIVKESYTGMPLFLAVRDRATERFLGIYIFSDLDSAKTSASLGWWLHPKARGRGLGVESLLLALQYAHDEVRIRTVRMGTSSNNHRAVAQIKGAGGTLVREAQHTLPNGETVDGLWFQHGDT